MNGLLLDFLISNKPMTTRLYRFGVLLEQPTKWGQVEAEVYTLSSNCWIRVETPRGSNVAVPCIGASSYAAFVSGAFIGCEIIVKIRTSFRHFNNEKLGVIALPDGHKLLTQDLMVFKGN